MIFGVMIAVPFEFSPNRINFHKVRVLLTVFTQREITKQNSNVLANITFGCRQKFATVNPAIYCRCRKPNVII